ncbi:hypothetical protein NB705_003596 [Xanthomonas sacchari]|nr:hypothetical protein [Xanthomonas sacchari]
MCDTADRVVDQALDLLGGIGRALGEGSHFAGDHGEAAALFAGTRRFHGRVQGEDVGLEGDAVDHADDVGDLLRRGLDPTHGLDHLADHRAALRGDRGCTGGELVGLAGVLGVLLDRGGQLFHRRSGLFQAGRLLFGAARQIVVAGGDLGRGAVDADRGGLDPRDDGGQLFGGGIGVVAHGGEHALELAVHARGQVAGGDRFQQRGQRLQVAIGGGHQLVEALDHQAEVVLEALGVATHAEVAGGGGAGQVLDLAVHRGEVALDRVHGFGQHRLFAGQPIHVLGQVADGVTAHDLRQAHLDRDMRGGQGVAVVDHAPVVAGEGRFVHAVADLAGVVALGHLLLRVEYRAQLLLHALQRSQQLPQFVVARILDAAVQAAGGDRAGDFHRTGQRLDHQPPQQQVESAAEQQRGAQADRHDGPQQAARLRHQHCLRHRHAQREALLGLADLQRHIHFHVGGAGLRIDGVAVDGLALGDLGQQGAGGRILQLLADQCRIAVGDDDAARREQADVAGTERAQLGDALLQRGQAEIGGDHTQELAVFQDRCADRGHQHLLAGDLVIVGFGDGRPQQLARIQIPVAGAGHVVVAQRIAHQFPVLPGPVHHVAAAGVMACAVGIVRVLAVQRLRFP